MIVSVMYKVEEGQDFNLDYYLKTHVPLVNARWGGHGLRGVKVLLGAGSPSGAPAAYHLVALLDFESLDAFNAAAAAHGGEILGDIANFTNGTPVIQFNETLI